MLYKEIIVKIIGENAFEQKNMKPRLKFNPWLALIGFQNNWAQVLKQQRKKGTDFTLQMPRPSHGLNNA